jgi:ferredoxin
MANRPHDILICSCEDTMPLDVESVRRGCPGAQVALARQLCRAELPKFRAAVSAGAPFVVGCTQEAPLFSEIADGHKDAADIRYVNIRETAGWSTNAANAGPKMAALIAAATEPAPEVPFVTLNSDGVALICGRDERAIEAANLLKDHLDVTVLIAPPAALTPPRVTDFPVVQGRIRSAKGHLGAFELTIDDFAQPSPSSRGVLVFGPARAGAVSRCDIVLDLSGSAPLFSAPDLRDGYLRADPDDPAAVLRAVLKARDLVGTFDKPRYIAFTEELCVHSRSRIVGCHRCLDLCPASAIAPAGDHVAIDASICAGCGQCAAACPTGAASYALPPADMLMRKLRAMLRAYGEAGGRRAIVLLHDDAHGTPLIDALARFGEGLPAHVLPICVNEVTQVGLEAIVAAFAYGASALQCLLRAKPRHDIAGLTMTLALAESILSGLGFGSGRTTTIETDDPDALGATLREFVAPEPKACPASFLPAGGKREVLRLALRELQRAAPNPAEVIALPEGAPFGAVEVDVNGCTLCLACVSACPTGALKDDPDQPMLRFVEDLCVQCGLCKATCPEKVITLRPQLDFRAATMAAQVLKREEPFNCIRCGKPFGVKSTIERVAGALAGKHWMYLGADRRLDAIRMCADCRVIAVTEAELDHSGAPSRPTLRTSEDYKK